MPNSVVAALMERLRPSLGERVSDAIGLRAQFGRSEAYREPSPPDLVARPLDAEEVRRIVGACHALRVPVVAFGAGTSLEGNAAAVQGGLCLDMSAMDQVISVQAADMDVRVGPGIRRKALNAALRDTGQFFPIDPFPTRTRDGIFHRHAILLNLPEDPGIRRRGSSNHHRIASGLPDHRARVCGCADVAIADHRNFHRIFYRRNPLPAGVSAVALFPGARM